MEQNLSITRFEINQSQCCSIARLHHQGHPSPRTSRLAEVVKKLLLSHSEILNTHPPTQDREMNREIELHYAERNRSGLIDRSWCGDRDSDVEQSQRTPSLHYTGYIVQTVCQLSVGRALPCWGLSGWTGAQPPRVREVTTPRTVVYRREQMI